MIYHDTTGSYQDDFITLIRKLEDHVPVVYDDRTDSHLATVGDGINITVDRSMGSDSIDWLIPVTLNFDHPHTYTPN